MAALFLLDRRLSAIAAVFALLEGFTRVYLGAHYPHDVLGSALVAFPVTLGVSFALPRVATPLTENLRTGRLRPLMAAN